MSVKDGGPAFPAVVPESGAGYFGMTLRDYFAGQVVNGLAAGRMEPYEGNASEREWWAEEAYAIADAMLKAREATHGD